MKILLDECLPTAERGGYDVLLTVDHGIQYQQPSRGRKLAMILIRARTNQIEDLLPLVDAILVALESIHPGETLGIPF